MSESEKEKKREGHRPAQCVSVYSPVARQALDRHDHIAGQVQPSLHLPQLIQSGGKQRVGTCSDPIDNDTETCARTDTDTQAHRERQREAQRQREATVNIGRSEYLA